VARRSRSAALPAQLQARTNGGDIMYRILANPVDDDINVTIRAACVDTLIEAKAFALAVLSDKVSSPVTSLRKIEDGFYGAYFGEVLVGFCTIESQNGICPAVREYSSAQEFVNNIPYVAMMVLGAAVFVLGFHDSAWGLMAAASYLAYGLAGAFWIMMFVCPYCKYWDSKSCPCGYGRMSARFREKSPVECFAEKFKKHIPVIVPLWFVPVLAGLPVVVYSFSWMLLVLLVVFALDAFIILPLISTKHGCKECPQKELCPWMNLRRKSAQGWSLFAIPRE